MLSYQQKLTNLRNRSNLITSSSDSLIPCQAHKLKKSFKSHNKFKWFTYPMLFLESLLMLPHVNVYVTSILLLNTDHHMNNTICKEIWSFVFLNIRSLLKILVAWLLLISLLLKKIYTQPLQESEIV